RRRVSTPLRPTQKPPLHEGARASSRQATHTGGKRLPEEVVDHVHHFAGVDVHQQHVVVVADPAIGTVDRRQAVLPRTVDPVAAAEQQRVEIAAYAEAAIAVVAIGRVIDADVEHHPVAVAVTPPVVTVVVAPAAVPAAIVAAVPAPLAAVLAPVAPVVAACVAI